MFFKVLDKFFDEIKQVISYITFGLIALSLLILLYWFAFLVKFPMPDIINNFVWGIVEFFSPMYKNLPIYQGASEVMPVFTAIILAVLIAILNFLMVLVEDLHKKSQAARDLQRINLEKQINRQLKKSFVNELHKNSFMLIKIKINASKEETYLKLNDDNELQPDTIAKEISYKILTGVTSDLIQAKGKTGDSLYFMITDFDKSKNFFIDLVAKSSKIMGGYLNTGLSLSFCCAADMYENISEFEKVNNSLEQVLDLKMANLIVVTQAVKTYYESLHPEIYFFKMVGEYPIKDNSGTPKTTSLYKMQRR